MKLLVCVVAVLAGLLSPVAAWAQDEMVDNPAYKAWASFKPGSSNTVKVVSRTGDNTYEMVITTTLKEVTADKVVIEVATTMKAPAPEKKMPPRTQTFAAKIAKREPPAGAAKPKVTETTEDVTVAAGTFKCTKTVTQRARGDDTVTQTLCVCDKVPGSLVKMVTATSDPTSSQSTGELIACKIAE